MYMANILASGYKDVFLPTTQCISTWRCLTLFSLQAVIVPNNTNQATIGDSQESQLYTNEAFYFSKIHTQMLIIGTDIFSHHIYFYSLASLFSRVKAIHKTPNKLIRLSTNLTLFETGIKVVDLLTPYVQGGKIDLFGGAGLGKTVVIMELIRNIAISMVAFLYLQVLVKELVKEMIFYTSTQVHSVNTNNDW